MGDQVKDRYKKLVDFEEVLASARMNAANDWEENFVADIAERYKMHSGRMFLTEKQNDTLNKIASDEDRVYARN